MTIPRKPTKQIKVGNVTLGGDAPVRVQSMCTADTRNVAATIAEIRRLEEAGCEIVRVACPDEEAADALGAIKQQITIPLIADIHFNYRLALTAAAQGVDGLRLNPGNIGSKDRVREVVKACKDSNIPIRIGVNAGSLEDHLIEKYGYPTPEAMVESALNHIAILEELDFSQIKVSLKASDVPTMIEAYRLFSSKSHYPLHLGVTEAGTAWSGTIYSTVGIGTLLAEGIGDTLRVSLTADPVEEVKVGYEILKALNLREYGPRLISCPTCGRLEINLFELAGRVEKELLPLMKDKSFKIAVMGCVVNGPGEARDADIGIAGGKGKGLVFRKGKIVRNVREDELYEALREEVKTLLAESIDKN